MAQTLIADYRGEKVVIEVDGTNHFHAAVKTSNYLFQKGTAVASGANWG